MKKKHIYLVGIGAALASTMIFLYLKNTEAYNEKPPKKAPQLDLDHPGDQSEFPKEPGESELG